MQAQHGTDLEADMRVLEAQLHQRVRVRILEQLQEDRQPQSAEQLAFALELHPASVQRALTDMLVNDQVDQVGIRQCRPVYRPVEVGPCEWCGVVSHRLVAGECPQHRTAVLNSTNKTFSNAIGRPSREIQLPPLQTTRVHAHQQATEPGVLRSVRSVQQSGLRLVRKAADRVRQNHGAEPHRCT
jgi:hypothetical protein